MAMPKRKSRPIHVDGANYRWLLIVDWGTIYVTVQSYDNPGQALNGVFDAKDGSTPKWQGRSITPKVVERLIRYAINKGWESDAPNRPPFRVEIDETDAWFAES